MSLPDNALDYISRLDELLVRAEALVGVRTKTIGQIIKRYDDELSRLTYDAFNGRISAGQMSGAMDTLISQSARDVYLEGMREGGSQKPGEDIDDDDEKAISDWIRDQLPHIGGYVTDAKSVVSYNTESTRAPILARMDLWVESLRSLGGIARAGFMESKPGRWIYGDTEHCDTCLGLNGQRHRLRWFTSRDYIPRQPGSETLDCGGWRCQCRIVDDNGEQLLP